jgi:hypothetical protein
MRGGKVLLGAGIGLGLCGLGLLGARLVGGSGEPGEPQAEAPAQEVATVPGPAFDEPYLVAYGAGGSATTASGVPIGFEQDCPGAVAAAASYAVATVTPLIDPAGWDATSYTGLLEELSAGMHATAGARSTEHLLDVLGSAPAVANAVPDARLYPTDSLFRVRSCVPGTAASVDLALVTGGTAAGAAFGGVMPVAVDLAWDGQDWRLVTLDPFAQWDAWQAMTSAPGEGWTPPLDAAGRAAIAEAGGSGWTEFTDAGH